MSGLPWVVRVLAAVFPREFRERCGEDMRQCILDARDALGDAPAAARARFWAGIAIDLARAGMLEHVRIRRGPALRLLGFASLAAAAGNVLADLLSDDLQMGIGALLLTALGIALGALLARPRPDRTC
jgi:hypothetical protein